MSILLDDISRIIASPVSRRHAIKLVSGAVGGALLTSLGLGRAAYAQGQPPNFPNCPPGHPICDSICCKTSEKCCWYRNRGNHCCQKVQGCCGPFCCAAGSLCCDGRCYKKRPSESVPCFAVIAG